MKKELSTLKQEYFDKLYEHNSDPWNFETSEYELQKYAKTISNLPKTRYKAALEIGCSIGVLTQMLAHHCESLLAIDISEPALEVAIKRLGDEKNITFKKASIPDSLPAGKYDLIVLSEVGYYLSLEDLNRAKTLIKTNLNSGADLILVHWTHEVADYPLTGDQVHEVFLKDSELENLSGFRTADFRLDVFQKN